MEHNNNIEYFSCVEDLGRLLMAKTAGEISDGDFEKLAAANIIKGLGEIWGGLKATGSATKDWVKSKKNPFYNAVGFAKSHPFQTGALGAGAFALGSMSSSNPQPYQLGYGARYR